MYCIKYSLSTPRIALSKPGIRAALSNPALRGFDNVIKSITLSHVTTYEF